MSRTSWSEFMGLIIWPLPALGFVGNFTRLNRRLVWRQYCSVSSSILSRLALSSIGHLFLRFGFRWFRLAVWFYLLSPLLFFVGWREGFVGLLWCSAYQSIYVVIAADIVWRIVSSRLCWIASVITGINVVTNDSLCILLLTTSAISISRLIGPLVDLAPDCFAIGLSVGVVIALLLVCRVFAPTECDSLRRGCRSLCLIS